ncbi:MAG: hypothetical protein QOI10_3910 [Solirubrobacterales bacterium]|nr:hypothetical protein [Solirubrobacterales bacterium]
MMSWIIMARSEIEGQAATNTITSHVALSMTQMTSSMSLASDISRRSGRERRPATSNCIGCNWYRCSPITDICQLQCSEQALCVAVDGGNGTARG